MKRTRSGFNLVELIIVIAVIGILAILVTTYISNSRERAYYDRAVTEFTTFDNALKLYAAKHNDYPEDVSRNIPAGLNEFIQETSQGSDWPNAPWPGSVYDYDFWENLDGEDTYQISIRFCPVDGPLSECSFPNEPWAEDFDINSAFYYCIKGNCRAHQDEPATYPGYCYNCPGNKAIGT